MLILETMGKQNTSTEEWSSYTVLPWTTVNIQKHLTNQNKCIPNIYVMSYTATKDQNTVGYNMLSVSSVQ